MADAIVDEGLWSIMGCCLFIHRWPNNLANEEMPLHLVTRAYQNSCKFIVAQEEENELAGYRDWLKGIQITRVQQVSAKRRDDGDGSRFSGYTVQQPVNTGEGQTLNARQNLIPSGPMVTSFAIRGFPRGRQFDKGKQVVNEKE
ncbi:PREDICTED: uncharacterized protein [Prunus dulcis]|uniref:PREDICTED: uncharacterized protein n=1 Tax=Prunus dulcis TaxID=3755 RepID=A0A5E4FK26_PRUDU|nr:PREDICTED: uncharacterized protein [Prunus dulcis]